MTADPYLCAICRHHKPVPQLARDCEARHARDWLDDDAPPAPPGPRVAVHHRANPDGTIDLVATTIGDPGTCAPHIARHHCEALLAHARSLVAGGRCPFLHPLDEHGVCARCGLRWAANDLALTVTTPEDR